MSSSGISISNCTFERQHGDLLRSLNQKLWKAKIKMVVNTCMGTGHFTVAYLVARPWFGVRLKVTLLPISMMVTDDEVENEQRIQASHSCIWICVFYKKEKSKFCFVQMQPWLTQTLWVACNRQPFFPWREVLKERKWNKNFIGYEWWSKTPPGDGEYLQRC